jgi:MFS family permease
MKKAWFLWVLTSFYFFFEWFLRVSPSVLPPFLEKELHTNLMDISTLSVMFYYPYLLMQIPVGIVVDRFNIKTIMVFVVLVFGLAALGFAQMPNIYYGYFCRFVMGLTGAFAFVGTLKIITLYFDKKRAALLTGITQGLGMLGAVIGLSPMYYCFVHYGWHLTLSCLSMVFFLIGALIWAMKMPQHEAHSKSNRNNLLQDVKAIISNKFVWFNAVAVGCFYAPTVAFGEQWGVSFLTSNHLTLMQSSLVVAVMFIGMTIGCPILGLISDTVSSRVAVMRWATWICLILMAFVIYSSYFHINIGYFTLLFLLFWYGFFQGALVVFYTLSTELVPLKLTGICIGLTNMASVIVGAIFIQLMAYLLQYMIYHRAIAVSEVSTANFQLVFLLFPLSFLIAIVSSYFIPETSKKLC